MAREKLEALEHLQKIDLQVEALIKDVEAGPARVAELEGQVAKARAAADLERGKVADNERARRHLENQLSDEKEKVKKWESRLPQLKHPREFAALEREITGSKKSNEAAEEELEALKLAFDPLKAALLAREAEAVAKERELHKEQKAVAAAAADLRQRIETLQGERERERPNVEPKLLAAYENVRKRRGGKVLVPMAGGTCTGCNRKLAPQLVNKLLNGFVESCPSCIRLVYERPAETTA